MMKKTKKTVQNVNFSHYLTKIVLICAIFLFILFLDGCAKHDPVTTIVDNHVSHIGEVIDYAQNNMEDSPDTRYLLSELKSCQNGLIDAGQSHTAVLSTCESNVKYWKLATLFASTIAGLLLLLFIRRK